MLKIVPDFMSQDDRPDGDDVKRWLSSVFVNDIQTLREVVHSEAEQKVV